ncbi:hypothetical protein M4951_05375 [Blastopirellula sp. J2-11]|uniref:aminopeptidase n=1 Tax=Blastopirellula sp. J2-11 TaxID=2943192 RepID=UPI0021C61C82|nr:hypothetical protein [Blastopirellula sp. J2-11]UUO07740.1 hypothetical protein M4951_05375 [Blastopirellula sp. J2-11]
MLNEVTDKIVNVDQARSAGAKKLVEVNGRVQPGNRVVVVTDGTMPQIASDIVHAATGRGARVSLMEMPERGCDGQEPPGDIAAEMKLADVIFSPVRRSITHTRAMRAALDAGARAILMTAYTPDVMKSAALLETDFEAQIDVCRRVGKAFTEGKELRLRSPHGTDLRFSIAGRVANVLTAIPSPGELAPVPTIEVNVVPVYQTAVGRLVADASVPYLGIGVLTSPITCEIADGYIQSIQGGEQAERLRNDLESHRDRNCFNVAELGVGLNPHAELTGVMLEDEGVLGTIHIGIGTSLTLGGEITAPTHYDLLMWHPQIEVDGQLIIDNRKILL